MFISEKAWWWWKKKEKEREEEEKGNKYKLLSGNSNDTEFMGFYSQLTDITNLKT